MGTDNGRLPGGGHIIRTARAAEGRFTQLANKLLQDDRIDDRPRGLGCRILSMPPGTRHTSESLCKGARQGRDATRKALAELEEYGYLRRTRRQVEGGHWITEWVLTDDPDALEVVEPSPSPKPEKPSSVPPAETGITPGRTEDGIPVVGGSGFKYLNTKSKHEPQTRKTAPSSLAPSSLTTQSRPRGGADAPLDQDSTVDDIEQALGKLDASEAGRAQGMLEQGKHPRFVYNTLKRQREAA